MPDGSIVEADGVATEQYIDVSALNDTFELVYPATSGAVRIAQYDIDKNSLGDSFSIKTISNIMTNVSVVKLDGCKYIRIMSIVRPTVCQLVDSVPEQ